MHLLNVQITVNDIYENIDGYNPTRKKKNFNFV